MQVAITSRHGTVGDDLRARMRAKAEKLLTYFERVTAIGVTVDFAEERVVVEILVDAEHKHDFVARDEGADVAAAFDGALHKIEQQIRRYKEKIQDHRRDRPAGELAAGEPAD